MTTRTIHTERLDLTPWAPEHAPALAQLARTSGVVPSIARNPLWDPEHPELLSRALLRDWEVHGFGWRAISERSAGVITGFVGVTRLGENDLGLDPADFELGCWVHPSHWRRGLAAEASDAVIDEAFRSLGAESVMGCARGDHRASIDGAHHLGLQLEQRVASASGGEILVMRVTAAEWAASHPAGARR